MNNSNAPALLRSLIVYAICVPLAIFVGYTLTNPLQYSSIGFLGIVGALIALPILLRWHHPLLVFSWSAAITIFFLPGNPSLWVVMAASSLGISILERILSPKTHFIRVPQITWPLLAMVVVAVITAEMTGGFGMRATGSSMYGGKKYVILFLGIASYFALTSRAIPPNKARLYVALFFLGQITAFIGDTYPVAPSWMQPIFLVFRPNQSGDNPFEIGVTRLGGVGSAACAVYIWLVSRYGLRGIFMDGKIWRLALFVVMGITTLLGGFRTSLFLELLIFVMAFFLEGLYRTWLLAPLSFLLIIGSIALIPLAPHLPFTFQRALAFLPVDIDSAARASANDSLDWRLNMWQSLLHEDVPKYILVGKGYAFSSEEFSEMMNNGALNQSMEKFDAGQIGLALAGDYHNGMLSLLIPFGIWGVLAFLWYGVVGMRAVYFNMKYGRDDLRTINTVLFILFLNEFISYVSCFGGLAISTDIVLFNGYLGMSIALNNGVCRPEKQTESMQVSIPEQALAPETVFQR